MVTLACVTFRYNGRWIWCLGAVDFIQKSFRDQELLDCIGETLKTNQTRCEARLSKSEIAEMLGKLNKRERGVFARRASSGRALVTARIPLHIFGCLGRQSAGPNIGTIRYQLSMWPNWSE
jgi:hypothetical protein